VKTAAAISSGVGGAGGNAVNNMIEAGLEGVEFIVCNTDAQALAQSKSGRRIPYGEVVKFATVPEQPPQITEADLKKPSQFRLIGRQDIGRVDVPSKVDGSAKYGIDAMVPGMLYGKPVVPPVRYGAKVAAVDDSTAKQVKGFVKAVTLDDKTGTTSGWVVAVATTYDAAKKAAEALKIAYDLALLFSFRHIKPPEEKA